MGIIFILMVIAIMTYALLIMPRSTMRPDMRELLTNYAHRGFFDNNDGVPENSLEAFRYAVLGVFGIELDLQLTKDGEVVVFHDYTLKRMCGADVKLSSLTLDELKSFNLLNTGYKIPTFKEVLTLVNGKVPLLIELKGESGDTSLCPAVDQILDDYKGAYSVESFNPLLLRWYKNNRPDVVRGQLVTNLLKEKNGGSFLRNLALSAMLTNCLSRPDFIAADQKYLRGISIRLCTQIFGTKLFVWTVRKKEHFDINKENGDFSIFEGFDPLS